MEPDKAEEFADLLSDTLRDTVANCHARNRGFDLLPLYRDDARKKIKNLKEGPLNLSWDCLMYVKLVWEMSDYSQSLWAQVQKAYERYFPECFKLGRQVTEIIGDPRGIASQDFHDVQARYVRALSEFVSPWFRQFEYFVVRHPGTGTWERVFDVEGNEYTGRALETLRGQLASRLQTLLAQATNRNPDK